MNSKALELKAKGVDVFAFGVGEPDFEPPEYVREAAKRAIDAGCSKYTAVTGIPALKEAICDATERQRGWRPKTENVCVSVGAKHTLFNLALALYEPGDEVIIPKPYWVSYPEQVRLLGATPVLVDTRVEDGSVRERRRSSSAALRTRRALRIRRTRRARWSMSCGRATAGSSSTRSTPSSCTRGSASSQRRRSRRTCAIA
jgi:aspartate/methionine/tyrosine aminotransferase